MQQQHETLDLEGLIRFYAEAGADIAMSETPLDRFATPPPAQRTAILQNEPQQVQRDQNAGMNRQALTQAGSAQARPTQAPPPPAPVSNQAIPDSAQIEIARSLARNADTLDALREQLAAFDGCGLKFTAKNLCFADGDPTADIMFVGEAPGRDEDMEGIPFVGRGGQLFERMLAAIDLQREQVYVANTIAWRPPGNRAPTPLEAELCRPFIERQIELAAPKMLVALGGPAAKILTGASEGILRLRGNWKTHTTSSGITIPVMPTLHPAYLLRSPGQKRFAWADFLEIKMKLKELRLAP